MSAPDSEAAAALRERRLQLDPYDLRPERARPKGSILQKQEEIVALGERLDQLETWLDTSPCMGQAIH